MSDSRPHYTTPVRRITRTDCETLIQLTLAEDTPAGDPTSESIFSFEQHGTGRIVARESGVLCGLAVIEHLCEINRERTGHAVHYVSGLQDGQPFNAGTQLLQLHGPLPAILTLERPVLNFLQYLSGISSVVARAVQAAGPDIAILDTRKTIPGYRKLAKYAVYCGGGTNHRICLSDMAMIKDNHVAAAGGITNAVQAIRKRHPDLPLEVEVDALE
ncbi:MAG: nicotinate-nucleotide diphosphorylase (carboxylating), partial [Leptospiraceae bacterium]|nr:nicotinate-nucleotide diphosphorylase (carboxylating) [Leptospiraceae bacterium]